MAAWRLAEDCDRRVRRRVRAAALLVLLLLLGLVVVPSRAEAAQTGVSAPQAGGPEVVEDYEPNTPAYAGAPWFEPDRPYAQNFPDPEVVWDGTAYWASSTSTGGPTLPTMWSTDLETWTARSAYSPNTYNSDPHFNDAFPVPPSWSIGGPVQQAGKAQWAPGMAKIGGKWVVYTSWEISPGRRCISSATSSSPGGPFVDSSSSPLVCDPGPGGSIDAEPFVDASGRPWLTWKAEAVGWLPSRIYSQPLAADGLTFAPGSFPDLLLYPTQPWEGGVVENPSIHYVGGAYWLVYSGHDWNSASYRMGSARCDSPAGPCTRASGSPLFGSTATDIAPGGGSMFVDATGRLRLAYHAWNAPYSSYPTDPNCDGGGECTSQGQRFLHVDGLVPWAGRLTVDPIGVIDVATGANGRIDVAGWALDPSEPEPIEVHLYVDGAGAATVANGSRPDVGQAFPGLGSAHGFSASVVAGPGQHEVCAYGIDVGAGGNNLIGCRSVSVPNGPPSGAIDVASGTLGGVTVAGWAADPDTSNPIQVHLYLDGRGAAVTGNQPRPDVDKAIAWAGPNTGYSAFLSAGPGAHVLCAYAINVGAGSNTLLGCREVSVPGGPPIGTIDVAGSAFGGIAVAGWAIDPDVAAPIEVHVYVDGRGVVGVADGSRPDVGAYFGPYGDRHGFSIAVSQVGPGRHEVCAFGINVGAGSNSLLGCRIVVVPDTSPFGALDDARPVAGGIAVGGWAIDPDTAGTPIDVHVYVDGVGTALRADRSRPDVGNAYPGAGPNHGYSATVSAPPGVRQVCAYGINVGPGGHQVLGCRTVTVS